MKKMGINYIEFTCINQNDDREVNKVKDIIETATRKTVDVIFFISIVSFSLVLLSRSFIKKPQKLHYIYSLS